MFTIIISVIVGLASGGLVHLILRSLRAGKTLLKGLPVLAAGGAMLFYNLYDEYTWYDRQLATFDPGMEVVLTYNEESPFRPWSGQWPYIVRFVAIDTASIQQNTQQDNLFVAKVHIHKRHESPYEQPMVIDCDSFKRADFAPIDPAELNWVSETPEHPIMKAVCGG
jgi:hypothetical protein